jgi:hypothetical protein
MARGPEHSEQPCRQLLNRYGSELEHETLARIQIHLASNAIVRGDFGEADTFLELALTDNPLLRQPGVHRINWLRMKAFSLYRQEQFVDALPYQSEALDIATQTENAAKIATCYNDLGATHYELGEFETSLGYLESALQALENSEKPYSEALTLSNIANIYRELGDLNRTLDYNRRALRAHDRNLVLKPNDFHAHRARAQTLEDLGVTLTEVGDYPAARAALEETMTVYRRADLPLEQLRAFAAKADLEVAAGNSKAALHELSQALELEQAAGTKPSVEVRKALVTANIQASDYHLAEQNALQGLAIARDSERKQVELFFLESLAQIAELRGELQSALNYYQDYTQAYKLWLEQRYNVTIAELQSSIHLAQQAQDIELLEAQARTLAQRRENQRWLVIIAIPFCLVGFGIVALLVRHRTMHKAWVDRELALRQQIQAGANPATKHDLEHAPQPSSAGNDQGEEQRQDDMNRHLVSLMLSCLKVWEQSTGTTRIELAEKSRVWQVSIDNGRLRTRTLDRYTDINRLPKSPRWRQVVRTCRYILINCELTELQRKHLNDELDHLFQLQRQQATRGDL